MAEGNSKPLLEGVLKTIEEIGSTFRQESNGIMGPAGHSRDLKTGHYSKLKIATEKDVREITYDGIILSDSINNPVQIYRDDKERVQLFDTKLKRWYR